MLHAQDHNPIRARLLAASAMLTLALAGCTNAQKAEIGLADLSFASIPQPGLLFDRAPPPVAVVPAGPVGPVLVGFAPPLVPDEAVDAAVAEKLRPWLTALERRSLAEASQRAAGFELTLQPVAWEARDAAGTKTAEGLAVAVDNPYRAVRGRMCRDMRQAVSKSDEQHEQQVTLCRQDFGNGLAVWIIGDADQ
jgi:surface antigen